MKNQKQLMMQKNVLFIPNYAMGEIPMDELVFDHKQIVKDFLKEIVTIEG